MADRIDPPSSVPLGRPPMVFYEVRTRDGAAYHAKGDVIEQGDGWFTLWGDEMTVALRIPEADIRSIRQVGDEEFEAAEANTNGAPIGCAVLHTDGRGNPIPCLGYHPEPDTADEGEGHPEPPPERTKKQQLRDRLDVAEYALQRVREAVGTDTPAEAQAELDRVNAALRANGFEYPLGARGVRDMATQRRTYLHELQATRERVTALEAILRDVLRQFVHETHPGERCLQTGHVSVATVERWRAALNGEVPDA